MTRLTSHVTGGGATEPCTAPAANPFPPPLSVPPSPFGGKLPSHGGPMHTYYPRSFLKLIAIGFVLVALPLAIALASATFSIGRLANHSEHAVNQAARIARDSRVLVEEITAMERSIRQYAILGDETLLESYHASRGKFQATAQELHALLHDPARQQEVAALLAGEEALNRSIIAHPESQGLPEQFAALAAQAREVLTQANDQIDREVETLQDMASRTRRLLALQLLALVPVAAMLIAGFTFLIVKPIRHLDGEIRRLGQGKLEEAVTVDGPEDLRYLGERLDWMRSRLLELEQQKSRFLRHISHELKTPLTALREGAELLSEGVAGELTPTQVEVTGILRNNTLRLQKLIEDLLDYNTLQGGTVSLALSSVKLDDLAREAGENQGLALQAKNLRLDLAGPAIEIEADGAKLRTVVDNLLSNAIKFSPPGETIRITLSRDAEHALLEVADRGPGIAPQDRERLFEPFYQGQRQPASHVKGSGLGLSIVKELVHAHHGSIELAEPDAAGARFRLRLPLVQPRETT